MGCGREEEGRWAERKRPGGTGLKEKGGRWADRRGKEKWAGPGEREEKRKGKERRKWVGPA